MNLTKTHSEIKDLLPATAVEIAHSKGYSSTSVVYDHIAEMRSRGVEIVQNGDKEYAELSADGGVATVTNHVEPRRQTTVSKAQITRKANEYLEQLELEVKGHRNEIGPAMADGGLVQTPGGQDIVIHRSDDHFGDVVKDVDGNIVFNSDIGEARVRSVFDEALDKAEVREAMGATIDTVHLLLGGDIVTNEAIYDGQAWEVESTIDEQLNRATAIYDDEIERLAALFPSVQVVCIGGNHGEFRVKGSSTKANADDLLYDRLEMLTVKGGLDNVQFVKSDRKDYVNFEMRDGKHTGHLRHGQFVPSHIGTSSPQNKWRGFLLDYEFDVGYRSHYHEHKLEHVNGRPVLMNGSIKDGGEFEGTLAAFGNPMTYIHGVTDETVLSWTDYIYYSN